MHCKLGSTPSMIKEIYPILPAEDVDQRLIDSEIFHHPIDDSIHANQIELNAPLLGLAIVTRVGFFIARYEMQDHNKDGLAGEPYAVVFWAATMAVILSVSIFAAKSCADMGERARVEESEWIPIYKMAATRWVQDEKSIVHCRSYGKCDVIPPHPMQPYSIVCDKEGACKLDP